MDVKRSLRRFEKPFIIAFASAWLLIYLLSRLVIEMSTFDSTRHFFLWMAAAISPFALYAALRTNFSEEKKWYAAVGYLLMYLMLGTVASHYMVINGDVLLSSAIHPHQTKEFKLLKVHKVFKRKLGFDHTAVSVAYNGKPLVLEARPYAFFYLKDKSELTCTYGTSALGNTYITSINVSLAEKTQARWIHLKDWVYRHRILWGAFFLLIILVLIQMKYFPRKSNAVSKTWSFWKLMALVMVVLFALALLAYASLWIYVSYFATKHY